VRITACAVLVLIGCARDPGHEPRTPAAVSPRANAHVEAKGAAPSESAHAKAAPVPTPASNAPADSALAEPRPAGPYPFQLVPARPNPKEATAGRHANLSMEQCRKALRERKLPAEPTKALRGIATPLRLTGPIHGVRFVSPGKRSVYGALDCRLVLALAELARVLAELDVVEVYVDNLYRPNARLPGKKKKRSQHAHGLAADHMG